MKRTIRLAALLGLSLAGCGVAAPPPGSEFADTPPTPATSPTPATALEAPARAPTANEAQGIAARGPEFAVPACVGDEEPVPGCVRTHDIDANTLGGDVVMTCGNEKQASNGCTSKPLAFEFVDEWITRPKMLTIAFDTAFFCATNGRLTQSVELNGYFVGAFEGRTGDCSCQAAAMARVIEVPGDSLGMLRPGLMNRVTIVGPNDCLALRPKAEWHGAYARVTAKY